MKHTAHKRIVHFKRRYKHIAAAFAGAILMSSALLPGIPVSTAQAAVKSNIGNTRDASAQQMENENRTKSLVGKKGKVSSSEVKHTIRQNLKSNKILTGTSQPPIHQGKAKNSANKADPPVTNPSHPSNTLTSKEKDASTRPSSDNQQNHKRAPSPSALEGNKDKQEKAERNFQKPQEDSTAKPDTEKKQSGNAPSKYEKVLDIKATAYSPGPLDNDQWGDKTYLGTTIRPGVVAVDPKVIPLGSRLYVEYPDGHGEYAVAEDTGGAIKGNRIDIAIMNRDKATEFGIKPVKVYVVNTPKE
ncbi:3D domain-containing protein [Pelosinus fermentans]|uniref:3D domain-containing protein n=1 Tax=Pelosinus fermentans JBW45 TaxID=1192197 RepID=I9NT23_9FIRM|nr:3D domain-containing protein [Pelosinus fermentans]AJQ26444.1 3D domain-containing protein [Pelosinus fermentans JBW45]